jgi:hypothetical protein
MNLVSRVQILSGYRLPMTKYNNIRNIYNSIYLLCRLEENKLQIEKPSLKEHEIEMRMCFIELLHVSMSDERFYFLLLEDNDFFSILENIYFYLRLKLTISQYIKYWLRVSIEWVALKTKIQNKLSENKQYETYLNNDIIPTYWNYILANGRYIPYKLDEHYKKNKEEMDKIVDIKDKLQYIFEYSFPNTVSYMCIFKYYYNVFRLDFFENLSTIFTEDSSFWDWTHEDDVYNKLILTIIKIEYSTLEDAIMN